MLSSHKIPQNLPKNLTVWLQDWSEKYAAGENLSVKTLVGDGSTRSFFRLSGSNFTKIILSEPNWPSSQDYQPMQQLLKDREVPVPNFEVVSKEHGIILMEDLGDELLQFRMAKEPTRKGNWLKRAIDLLAAFHGKLWPLPEKSPAIERRFDTQKFYDELCFTEEHLSQKLLHLPALGSTDLDKIKAFAERISRIHPQVICHRDYHCRNLLVHTNRLYLIDFQDARLGPPHYDLASLIFDPYVDLSWSARLAFVSYYLDQLSHYPGLRAEIDYRTFETDLCLVGYQRLVKAMGSFASFYTRYQKKTHLQYLNPALEITYRLQEKVGDILKPWQDAFRLDAWQKSWQSQNLVDTRMRTK